MKTLAGLASLVGVLVADPELVGGLASPALAAELEAAAVGRIEIVEGSEGFIIAEFPKGRMLIGMDKRELWRYQPGDEIRIDSFGRPLPPRVVR